MQQETTISYYHLLLFLCPKCFGSSFELIHEIATTTDCILEEDAILSHAVVIVVYQLEELFICLHCKKTSSTMNKSVATCSFSNTTQKINKTQVSARLYLEDENGQTYLLKANSNILAQIVLEETVSSVTLLAATVFSLTFDKNTNCIKSVTRD